MIAMLLLCSSLAACKNPLKAARSESYSSGYDDGYAQGQKAGYDAGYAQGHSEGEREGRYATLYDYSSAVTTVEVCGGGGTNVGKKYVPPGKTGCVRVYSDGRYERY